MFKNNIWQIGDILRYDYAYQSGCVHGIVTEKLGKNKFRVIWFDDDCTTEFSSRDDLINLTAR